MKQKAGISSSTAIPLKKLGIWEIFQQIFEKKFSLSVGFPSLPRSWMCRKYLSTISPAGFFPYIINNKAFWPQLQQRGPPLDKSIIFNGKRTKQGPFCISCRRTRKS